MPKKKLKKKITPRRKWDWAALKTEFMDSKYKDVTTFFTEVYRKFHGGMRDKTIGWAAEKKERNERIAEQVIKDREVEEVIELKKALNNIVVFFKNKVATTGELNKLSVRDAVRVWEVIRTENGLPTSITRNTNLNENRNLEAESKAFDELDKYASSPNNTIQDAGEMEDTTGEESEEDLPF